MDLGVELASGEDRRQNDWTPQGQLRSVYLNPNASAGKIAASATDRQSSAGLIERRLRKSAIASKRCAAREKNGRRSYRDTD